MKNMKYIALLACILFIFCTVSSAQDEDYELSGGERIVYGLNISWTNQTVDFFEAMPNIGYRITPEWIAGVGFKYEYFKASSSFFGNSPNIPSTHIYGGALFTNYEFLKNTVSKGLSFFAHAEMQELSLSKKYFKDPAVTGRFFYNTYVFGPGVRQRIGRRASFNISLLFAVHKPSPSAFPDNPYLRFGFIF